MLRNPAVQVPSLEELKTISSDMKLKCTEAELLACKEYYKGICDSYQRVYDLVDETPVVKYPRLPGHKETHDPAWYWRCDIRGADEGVLAGKTLAIKDCIAVAGVPMTIGSKIMQGYIPEIDASVVTRILNAGGHILGTSSCEDMCSGSISSWTCASGGLVNPFDSTRTTGGSSSGSASLISRGIVNMALGSDQGGSIRIPAAWCGIVGLKPTYGLVPFTGCASLERTVDHVGPMAGTVMDCALLLEVIAGYDNGLDPRQPRDIFVPKYSEMLDDNLQGRKIGILIEGFQEVNDDVCDVVNDAINRLKQDGAMVEKVSIPLHNDGKAIWTPIAYETRQKTFLKESGKLTDVTGLYWTFSSGVGYGWKGFYPVSLSEHLAMATARRAHEASFPLRTMLMFGEYIERNYQAKFYAKAQNLARTLTKAYDEVFKKYDVIVMPSMADKASKLPAESDTLLDVLRLTTGMTKNMPSFNVTGHPAISVNAGYTDGLPCGIMIVGKMFDDATVLQVAYAVEKRAKDRN